jgi:hypothetical protein
MSVMGGLLLLVQLAPQGGSPQQPSRADIERERVLVVQAEKQGEKGDHSGALASLQAAYEVRSEPGITYRMGIKYEELRRPSEAIDAYDRYLIVAPNGIFARDARHRWGGLRPQVVLLDLRIDPADATITLDALPIGPGRARAFTGPGEHVIRVSKDGFAARSEQITAAAGGTVAVTVKLTPTGLLRLRLPREALDLPDLEVTLDGRRLTPAALAIPHAVTQGQHTVAVEVPTYHHRVIPIHATGTNQEVEVKLVPRVVPSAVVTGAIGLGTVAAGLILHARARSKLNWWEERCYEGRQAGQSPSNAASNCIGDARDQDYERYGDMNRLSRGVLLTGGAVAIAGSGWMAYLHATRPPLAPDPEPRSKAKIVAALVTTAVGAGAIGIGIGLDLKARRYLNDPAVDKRRMRSTLPLELDAPTRSTYEKGQSRDGLSRLMLYGGGVLVAAGFAGSVAFYAGGAREAVSFAFAPAPGGGTTVVQARW